MFQCFFLIFVLTFHTQDDYHENKDSHQDDSYSNDWFITIFFIKRKTGKGKCIL